MHTTINLYQFCTAFRNMGRKDQFSLDGLEWLFNYLEQCEEDTGEAIELDVIALCCDYTEATYKEILDDYNIDISKCEDEEEIRETVLGYLNDNTTVVGSDNDTVLYANF